jgi:hypothetical protein
VILLDSLLLFLHGCDDAIHPGSLLHHHDAALLCLHGCDDAIHLDSLLHHHDAVLLDDGNAFLFSQLDDGDNVTRPRNVLHLHGVFL